MIKTLNPVRLEIPMQNDDLGNRMKKYEYVTRTHLVPRMPVIIRIDGRAFHTFTRGFHKPFDYILVKTMQETMRYLCENIQGCVLGYTQSDEITLVLIDYKKLDSCAWFDYNIQKCCSIAASMATMAFNQLFEHEINELYVGQEEWDDQYFHVLMEAVHRGAMFDARCFNVPKEEVTNCILWRQNDATRNSVEMVGHANFSQTQLHKKSCAEIQEMLFRERGINWNDYPTHYKRGSCCVRRTVEEQTIHTILFSEQPVQRTKWVIDTEIPIFKGEGRKYIDDLIFVGES